MQYRQHAGQRRVDIEPVDGAIAEEQALVAGWTVIFCKMPE
ncbi:hypothetical protein ACQ4W6_22315 [Janthinobacterium sp. HLX7-2]